MAVQDLDKFVSLDLKHQHMSKTYCLKSIGRGHIVQYRLCRINDGVCNPCCLAQQNVLVAHLQGVVLVSGLLVLGLDQLLLGYFGWHWILSSSKSVHDISHNIVLHEVHF